MTDHEQSVEKVAHVINRHIKVDPALTMFVMVVFGILYIWTAKKIRWVRERV